jgi:hypothetical protein
MPVDLVLFDWIIKKPTVKSNDIATVKEMMNTSNLFRR